MLSVIMNMKEPENDSATALAIWSEDIILDPGTIRYPIRIVAVDNLFQTRLDRLVQLPKNSTTYIYRVLDHGIPWQHLEAGLPLEDVKTRILTLAKGKLIVVYDAWKTLGLLDFSEEQLSQLKIYDLRTDYRSLGPNGDALSYWDLVQAKLGHRYTGKPGNYDTIELTDFTMSIFLKYLEEEKQIPANSSAIVEQLQLPLP